MAMNMNKRKTELEDLRDETLMEILVRVPVKSCHQCKVVSKRWLALISSPYFVRFHRQHHDNHHLQIVNYVIIRVIPKILNFKVQSLPKNHPLISLDFLKQKGRIKMVVCVSNDLLLTKSFWGGSSSFSSLHLKVLNPLTKQSYTLPEPPPCFLDERERNPPSDYFKGIVCSVDDPALYKVVLVKNASRLTRSGDSSVRSSEFLSLYVFTSDTSSWCNFLVPAPPDFAPWCREQEAGQYTTVLDGALYWCTNMIMVYNPFDKDDPQHCEFIHLPQEAQLGNKVLCNHVPKKEVLCGRNSLCIANVEQHLRLYHCNMMTASTQTLIVWDYMKDDYTNVTRTWSKKHFVDLTSINWACEDVCMSIKGFDPCDGDVLYVLSKQCCLLAVNLKNKTVQLVNDFFDSNISLKFSSFGLLPYCPPSWPTPITNSIAATATATATLL